MNPVVTLAEISTQLHIGRTLIWKLRKDPSFPKPIRLGKRRVVYDAADVRAWLDSRKVA